MVNAPSAAYVYTNAAEQCVQLQTEVLAHVLTSTVLTVGNSSHTATLRMLLNKAMPTTLAGSHSLIQRAGALEMGSCAGPLAVVCCHGLGLDAGLKQRLHEIGTR